MSFPVKVVTANKCVDTLEFQAILIKGSSYSHIILLSVRSLISNNRAVKSHPTVTKLFPSGPNEISNTSLS